MTTTSTPRPSTPGPDDAERRDLIETLDTHRGFLRRTVRGLSDEEAARRTTVSELCLGGIVKHVAAVEDAWCRFMADGPAAFAGMAAGRADTFRMLAGDTLAGLLHHYQEVADRTEAAVAALPSLDRTHPLPEAPWREPGTRWSARRVLLHVLAETAQHAGHADIVREALDGARTMG